MRIENEQVITELMLILIEDMRNPSSMFVRIGEAKGNQIEVVTVERTKFRIAVARIMEGDEAS